MRPEPHQIEVLRVRLAVDEHEVRLDVAVAMVVPLAGQGVIKVTAG